MSVPPAKKVARTHRLRPLEEETAGKLYLVRDKDTGDGKPVMWARDLPFLAAQRIKEETAGRRLSRTVQIEEQTDANAHYRALPIDPRSSYQPTGATMDPVAYEPESLPDPGIAAAQAAARAAAAPIAAAANARAQQPPPSIPPEAMKPPPMPELPAELENGEAPIDPDELDKLLSGSEIPSAEDLAQATADLDENIPAPVNVLELAGKFTCPTCGAAAGAACNDPAGPITHPQRIQIAAQA